MNVTLRDQLKQLRLSGLSESLEGRLHEAQSAKLDYAEFLELILQDELVIRQDRQIARRIKAAAFRDQKSLDDFDFAFNPSVKRKQIYDLETSSANTTTRFWSVRREWEKAIWCKASAGN